MEDEKQMAKDNLYEIISEMIETIILIRETTVRPISGGKILKSSKDGVTVKVSDGDVLRIGDDIYIWNADKKSLEIQC